MKIHHLCEMFLNFNSSMVNTIFNGKLIWSKISIKDQFKFCSIVQAYYESGNRDYYQNKIISQIAQHTFSQMNNEEELEQEGSNTSSEETQKKEEEE